MDWSAKVKYLKINPVTVERQIDYVFKQFWGKVTLIRVHLIDQVLNFDKQGILKQRNWTYPCHNSYISRFKNWWKCGEWVSLVSRYVYYLCCAWWDKIPWNEQFNNESADPTIIQPLVERKKGVVCRFNALWEPSDKSRIVNFVEKIDETIVKQSKNLIKKELSYNTISDLSEVT